jgi:flagellar biosynthesis GTPase FlhF
MTAFTPPPPKDLPKPTRPVEDMSEEEQIMHAIAMTEYTGGARPLVSPLASPRAPVLAPAPAPGLNWQQQQLSPRQQFEQQQQQQPQQQAAAQQKQVPERKQVEQHQQQASQQQVAAQQQQVSPRQQFEQQQREQRSAPAARWADDSDEERVQPRAAGGGAAATPNGAQWPKRQAANGAAANGAAGGAAADPRAAAPLGAMLEFNLSVPDALVRHIIGKQGSVIKRLQEMTGCSIHVPKEADAGDPDTRTLALSSTNAACCEAAAADIQRILQQVCGR